MNEHWIRTDLQKLPEVAKLPGQMFQDDSIRIGVIVTDGGEPINLGGTISVSIIKPNGQTITETGSKSGNTAWIDIPSSIYSQPGMIGVFIKLVNGTEIATLGGVEAFVYKTM